VPRPKQPLLSRDLIVQASVRIIDREGLGELNLPSLAQELGVRAPSLYHHFRDKAEILAEVARAIVLETPYPKYRSDPDWVTWMVDLCVNFRRAILRHPNAAPLLLEFLPRDVMLSRYEKSARKLRRAGVPEALHVTILDGCEKLALGSGLVEALHGQAPGRDAFRELNPTDHQVLAQALDVLSLSSEELFRVEVRNFLDGCVAAGAAQFPGHDGTASSPSV
jgi:AcrR family transcriptional regulator